MKYFVNAPARRSKSRSRTGRKKPRSAAQKAATKKMRAALAAKKARSTSAKRRKRATTRRSPTVAKRKRKRGGARRTARKSSRRRSTTKRRSPVTRLRRHAVYSTNPRKRRRRSRYHRNPSYVKQAIQIGKDTAAVLAGGAAGRTIGGMLPSFGNPVAEAAKGILIAIAIRMAASRFLGADVARFAAAGAMQVPLKNLVVGFLPQAAPFLGDYDLAMLSSYSGAGALSGGEEGAGMGSYSSASFAGMQ